MLLLNLPTVETLIDVPIFGGSGRTKMQRIESAYDYLLSRSDEIDLVNMSWGAPRRVQAIDRLHNELEQSGVNAIVASGNTDQQTGSPATAERAFSVAAVTEAVTEAGRMTRFSSPTDDVSALGRNIAVPKAPGTQMGPDLPEGHADTVIEEIGGDWVVVSGTSFAAPIALGYSGSLMTAPRSSSPPGSRTFRSTSNERSPRRRTMSLARVRTARATLIFRRRRSEPAKHRPRPLMRPS